MPHVRTLITLPLTLALLAAASLPLASAQDEPQDGIVLAEGHAEGRFVAFDVADGGAVCDWSFEGRTVIEAMAGVSGQARTQGRAVIIEGDAPADGSCSVQARAGDDDAADDGEADDADDGDDGEDPDHGGMGDDDECEADGDNCDSTTTTSSSATSTSPDATTTTTTTTTSAAPGRSGAGVTLHDNPSGHIAFDLEGGEAVRIDFGAELEVDVDGDTGKVSVQGEGLEASLFLTKGSGDVDVRVEGSSVTLEAASDADVHFRVHDDGLDDDDEDMDEHVDDGDVACEVFVSDEEEPHVVAIDGSDVTVLASLSEVRVDLDINIDVEVDVDSDSDSDGTTTQSTTQTQTVTSTRTQTTTVTRTQTAPPGDDDGGDDGDDDGNDDGDDDGGTGTHEGCGCAVKVLILDVDVTVFVLEADDDLLVSLNGVLLARADSVEDALTIEAGEDPEALVVVNQDNEVKVLASLAAGSSQLSLEAQEGESFETREPVRHTRTTTLDDDGDDDGFAPVNDIDPDDFPDSETGDGGADVSVPGFGWGAALIGLIVVTMLGVRRRLE